VGEVVTAAQLNTEIRDQFNDVFASWSTYTPTWTASTNPTIGNGTITGRYKLIGKTCLAAAQVTIGSTTTLGSGQYSISLPVAPRSAAPDQRVMVGVRRNSDGSRWVGDARATASTITLGIYAGAASGSHVALTGTTPISLAASDSITLTGTYEAA
jgi:hypothetical protein